jgi:hypothetical protein
VTVVTLMINIRKRHRWSFRIIGISSVRVIKSKMDMIRYNRSERVKQMKRNPVEVCRRGFAENVIRLHACPRKPKAVETNSLSHCVWHSLLVSSMINVRASNWNLELKE